MTELLNDARNNRYAIAAFECWGSANIHAISQGAAECGMPVIFQASPTEYGIMGGPEILRKVVETYVNFTGITAALHLDHATTLQQIELCVKAGFTSVMLDASRKHFNENLALSKAAAKIAHQHSICIEAELGHVGGLEGAIEESEHDLDCLTDPDEAIEFVRETGIDCLAVGIGTVHGDYKGEPKINLERLKEISAVIDIPLVLHGGSGTPEDIIRKAIRLGISKINICTEIHKSWLEGVALAKKELTPSIPGKFYQPAHNMLKEKVIEIIKLFTNIQ